MAVVVFDVEEHVYTIFLFHTGSQPYASALHLQACLCKEIIQVRITPNLPCREELDMMLCRAHD